MRQFKRATVYTTHVCKLDDNLRKLDLLNLKYFELKTELSSIVLLPYNLPAFQILGFIECENSNEKKVKKADFQVRENAWKLVIFVR